MTKGTTTEIWFAPQEWKEGSSFTDCGIDGVLLYGMVKEGQLYIAAQKNGPFHSLQETGTLKVCIDLSSETIALPQLRAALSLEREDLQRCLVIPGRLSQAAMLKKEFPELPLALTSLGNLWLHFLLKAGVYGLVGSKYASLRVTPAQAGGIPFVTARGESILRKKGIESLVIPGEAPLRPLIDAGVRGLVALTAGQCDIFADAIERISNA